MKIAVNIDKLSQTNKRGVSVYMYNLLKQLSYIDNRNDYILYSRFDFEDKPFLNNPNFSLKVINSRLGLPFWTYIKLPQQVMKDSPDIVFMPIQHASFIFKKPNGIKIVTTVLDLAFKMFPNHFTFKDKFGLNVNTKIAIENSDKIIAISNSTKNDIVKFYKTNPEKISVIHLGNRIKDIKIEQDNEDSIFRKNNIKKPYILFVGVIQPRKNIVKLINAFEIVRKKNKNISLVICGEKGWLASETYKRAEKSEYFDDIIFTGGVDDKELISLYKNAKMFILPSLYEGFGIPVVEAMGLGLPVIVANNSSLCEIAGDAGLFINEYDQNDIAEKMNVVLNNKKVRKVLSEKSKARAKKFSWYDSAIKHLEIFNNLS